MAELQKKQRENMKKDILVLIYQFLLDEGLLEVAEALKENTFVGIEAFTVCDNVDLSIILLEYQAFYQMRFHKKSNLTKRKTLEEAKNSQSRRKSIISGTRSPRKDSSVSNLDFNENLEINGTKSKQDENTPLCIPKELLQNEETRHLVLQIARDFIKPHQKSQFPNWDNVIGHETVKQALEEGIVLPFQYPDLFQKSGLSHGKRAWLLAGPPGTGKTLLAQAVAMRCQNMAFFSLSGSSLCSKWRGESEKLMRYVFDLAEANSPSIIFMDELDSILGDRGNVGEHEASKRCKAEFLVKMDGLVSCSKPVFLIGATNMPWALDPALLRRFETTFYIRSPSLDERIAMFKNNFKSVPQAKNIDWKKLSEKLQDFSGSDIARLCQQAKRQLFKRLIVLQNKSKHMEEVITEEDLHRALKSTKSTKNEKWNSKYQEFFQEN